MNNYKKSDTENIRKKIELYLRFNNTTIAGLAKTVTDVPYQTIYRIINQADYSLSTNSIKSIATFFNAPIDKFVSPFWTLELDYYSSLASFWSQSSHKINIDLRLDILEAYDTLDYFVLSSQLEELGPITYSCNGVNIQLNSNYVMLFQRKEKLTNEGYYLCKITNSNGEKKLLVANIVSINSLTIIAIDNKTKEYVTIEKKDIHIFGKYVFSIPVTEEYQPAIAYKPTTIPISASPAEFVIETE